MESTLTRTPNFSPERRRPPTGGVNGRGMRNEEGGALFEREEELRELEGVVEQAGSGAGRLVLIEGPAGIGKTRLLDAAPPQAREHGMVVLAARASELDRTFPFG